MPGWVLTLGEPQVSALQGLRNWAMKVSDACDIILDMLKEEVLKNHLIHIDETTLNVLNEPGRKKSYMWVYKSSSPGAKVILYEYHASRSGDVPKAFLKNYHGIVQTDGYKGYDFLDSYGQQYCRKCHKTICHRSKELAVQLHTRRSQGKCIP